MKMADRKKNFVYNFGSIFIENKLKKYIIAITYINIFSDKER